MSARLLAGLAGAWLVLPGPDVQADMLRSAADRAHVVVVQGNEVWRILDGGPLESIPVPDGSWVLDALPDRDGAVWIAIGPIPREGPARLGRAFAGAETEWRELRGSSAASDLHFVPRRRAQPVLIGPDGAWTTSRSGAASRMATWSLDGYGFYAATARLGSGGALTVLAPAFNTCGSADILEGVVELHARGARFTTRAWAPRRLGYRTPALGADGAIYRWFRDDRGRCTLETAGAGATRGNACDALVRHNGETTVAVIDQERVVRLERPGGRASVDLGRLDPADQAVDVSPDQNGGALVLMTDGRVVRFGGRRSGRGTPVLSLSTPGAP